MTTTIEAMKQLQQIIAAVFRDPQNITRDHLEVMKRLVGEAIAAEEAQKVEITEKFKALSENRKEIITGPCGQCKSSKVPCGCKITEGVESYDGIGGTGQDTSRNVDGISKTNLRPISPANTEFLTIKLELMTAERDKLLLELGDLRALRAARPAPPADHIGDATKLVGEREALITQHRARAESAKLRGPNYSPCISADELLELLDMRCTDAQDIERKYISPVRTVSDLANNLLLMDQALPIYGAQYIDHPTRGRCAIAVSPTVSRERVKDSRWIGQGSELNAAIVWTRAAQQVAVPQGWKLVPESPTLEMMSQMPASCNSGEWCEYYSAMLAATPKPPQADALAADHIEDVLAMVPMTAKELDDLLPTNDSMSRKDSQRWIARAVERHHKIGVKP